MKLALVLLVLSCYVYVNNVEGRRIRSVCSLPLKVGPCRAAIRRFYFNRTKGKCVQFSWGGCKPNGNNFKSLAACKRRCPGRKPVRPCFQPQVVGRCKGRFPRWSFNRRLRRCVRFYYGGCGGNKNNFRTRGACQRKCPVRKPARRCHQAKVVGPCYARLPRWYYNRYSRRCYRFYYGGCRGNGNNFRSRHACQRTCRARRHYYGGYRG